jgi:hypothetical protein
MCRKIIYKTSHKQIDKCMRPLIGFLRDSDYTTVASCCGHDKYPMTIVVEFINNGIPEYRELLSGTIIPRNRRFYKRDNEGYYYIPEVTKW